MKTKYSDGGDIITSDDDNPDDQEVHREFTSTGVKIRDTPPGKKAVGRNMPRPTAPREQKDASPKTPVAKTKATTFYELRGKRATRAGEQQQQRQLQRGKMELRSGGYVKAADGCAKRGKTKAKMV